MRKAPDFSPRLHLHPLFLGLAIRMPIPVSDLLHRQTDAQLVGNFFQPLPDMVFLQDLSLSSEGLSHPPCQLGY